MCAASMQRRTSLLRIATLAFCAMWPTLAVPQATKMDLALVLAIDCSFSVDAQEFRLQMRGLGQALQSNEVWDAIAKGPNKRIAIAAYHWSDMSNQQVILEWTVIASSEDATRIGKVLENAARRLAEGGTATANALTFGAAMFGAAPLAERRVIDLSTDGRNNMGPPVKAMSIGIVARGITVNGLAITNEWSTLDTYMENQIIGGQGAFVERAESYDDFGAAMVRKLVREIVGPGLT